ncbi:Eukaryotic initiation factor 4A-3 [Clonorchis sinensis]|uniref:RNA helicase n=1 Tax=Clonorchis sinensis TaxID=79923 RepID=A0A419Q5I5_CLOSI|nr:Eukaryotic initiation factor 4A-3 [Clonorchis sinensis]
MSCTNNMKKFLKFHGLLIIVGLASTRILPNLIFAAPSFFVSLTVAVFSVWSHSYTMFEKKGQLFVFSQLFCVLHPATDLIRQGSLRLDSVRSLVLDEADEMLNRGLRTQLEEIYRRLPFGNGDLQISNTSSTQVIIISATMPHEQLEVFYRFTKNPVQVLVPRDELTLAGLHQFYVDVGSEEWKFEALGDLFASVCVPQTVVFVNTRRKADWLSTQLRRDSYTVEAAHGDLDQALRETVMERFRSGASRILVCSDIWARGIDVQNVGLVVNYDLPATPSDYLHRIGRSGRFGRRGLAVSFVAGADDRRKLDAIARQYRIAIPPAPAALDKMLTWSDSPTSVDPAPTSLSAQELKSVVQSIKAKGRKRKRPKKRKNKISSQ